MNILDFRHYAKGNDEIRVKRDWVESRGQYVALFTPVEFRGEMNEMSELIFLCD